MIDFSKAMKLVRPQGDYLVDDNEYSKILMLDGSPLPTEAELQAAYDAWLAAVAEADSIRTALRADFEALPSGVQVAISPAFDAVHDCLVDGRITEAKEIISTYPLLPALESARTVMLSRFP